MDKEISMIYKLWKVFERDRIAKISFYFLIFLILFSFIGPLFVKYSYFDINLSLGATPPSWNHPFGTDILGRDMLSRIMYGGQISLEVGFCATAVSIIIGVIYGAISGYYGGKLDAIMMRIVDVLYSLPFTIFAIILMVWLGRNFILIFVAIGAVEWLTMARIVRGEVLSIKKKPFIEAARAIGLGDFKIVFGHILPNIIGVIIIYSALTIPRVMMVEAFLSFLGLGIQPPMTSWGLLIKNGAQMMEEYPWLLIFPAIFFSCTLFALNFIGDALRDILDPKSINNKTS